MRWRPKRDGRFRKWFTWRPVTTERGERVWLEFLVRRWVFSQQYPGGRWAYYDRDKGR